MDHATWHWDFWFNVIIAALAFVIMVFFLKGPQNQQQTTLLTKIKSVDWLGTLFSTSFIVCLLLALNWGGQYGWNSGHSIGPFVAAGVSLIVLIYVEGWVAKDPVSFCLNRSFTANVAHTNYILYCTSFYPAESSLILLVLLFMHTCCV